MKPWPFDDQFPYLASWLTSDVSIRPGAPMSLIDEVVLKAHPLLATATSKLRWGHKHLVSFETKVKETFAGDDYRAQLNADRDEASGFHIFKIVDVPDLSGVADEIANATFDVAGNFRAALDKLAWKIVTSTNNGVAPDPPGVKFPICADQEKWSNDGRAVKQFDPTHRRFIEKFQPYHGTNGFADSWSGTYIHPLAMLQSLSNEAKHRDDWPVIMPGATAAISRRALPVDFDEYLAVATQFRPQPLSGIGQPMAVGNRVIEMQLYAGADQKIVDAGRLFPEISFAEGRRIIDSLKRVESYVQFVLSEFARNFP